MNNALAGFKILILLAIIIIGFSIKAGAHFGNAQLYGETIRPLTGKHTSNFDPHTSFAYAEGDVASYAYSLLYVMCSFSGFEQPFYVSCIGPDGVKCATDSLEVLSEVRQPKRIFAVSTIGAMLFVDVLFVLVNIAYVIERLCPSHDSRC